MTRYSDLLNGRSTGGLFLLGWTLGISLAYAFVVILIVGGLYNDTTDRIWLGLTGCTLGLSAWQATLLLPTWWRRLCWILVFLIVSLTTLNPLHLPIWHDSISITAAIQGLFLVGVRKRVWLWTIVAILVYTIHLSSLRWMLGAYSSAYGELARYLPTNYVLSFSDFYTVVATIAFGIAAAYFMPPIENGLLRERQQF